MKKVFFFTIMTAGIFFASCDSDDNNIPVVATCDDGIKNGDETGIDCGGSCAPCLVGIENPADYTFDRDGKSTVYFNGQTILLEMGSEFKGALGDNTKTKEELMNIFSHAAGNIDFSDADLNASDGNIKNKTAASIDLFAGNATDQAAIRADFEAWIAGQVNEVFTNWEVAAKPGIAGQLPQGDKVRYVSADGSDYVQKINKGLIGAMVLDQVANNYLSPKVLDADKNRANNDADVLEGGKTYTAMEHAWDEAYGYVFALNTNGKNPVEGEKGDDKFMGDYLKAVSKLADFTDLEKEVFEAFKLGRAAIVAKDYKVRDEQAAIIKSKLNLVPAVRGVFYLQAGKDTLAKETPDYGGAFHAIAEGQGFIYSLLFARDATSGAPYFSKTEIDGLLAKLVGDGDNGLWDVKAETLDAVSETIATRLGFTVAQASPQ